MRACLRVGACTLLLTALLGVSAAAYLKLGTDVGTAVVPVTWTRQPIGYLVSASSAPGVSMNALQGAVERAFGAWTSDPAVAVESAFLGFTGVEPVSGDGLSTIGFKNRPDLDRTLGATSFEVDAVTGEVLEADIFFNTRFAWSTTGDPGAYDLESIAVHEIGHLLGLGHSALGETDMVGGRRRVVAKRAVMFPIAFPPGNIEDRTPEADDRAGLIDLYGTPEARAALGAIAGRVTRNGAAIFGAHVLAFNIGTGVSVGGFTLSDDGRFVIAGLAPGLYVVRVEPLDDADLGSFFEDEANVDLDFLPTFHPELVAVASGGAATIGDVRVQSR